MIIPSSGEVELLGATVDDALQQNVPLPPQQQQQRQTNSVLAGMINSAKSNKSSGLHHHHSGIHVPSSSSSSMPATTSTTNPLPSLSSTSTSSEYVPSSPLPTCLQFTHSSHPTACLFHVLFKCLALGVYMLGSKLFWFEDVLVTVLCILLLAADFWVVKNITGRLLVGLRWWNKVDVTTGETSWIFESASAAATTTPYNSSSSSRGGENNNKNNAFDTNFFWAVLYLTPILWCILSLSAILWLNFRNLVTLICALVLSISNVVGYYKCSAEQRERWSQLWMNGGAAAAESSSSSTTGAMSAIMMRNSNAVMNRMYGIFGGRQQQVPQQEMYTMTGTFA